MADLSLSIKRFLTVATSNYNLCNSGAPRVGSRIKPDRNKREIE